VPEGLGIARSRVISSCQTEGPLVLTGKEANVRRGKTDVFTEFWARMLSLRLRLGRRQLHRWLGAPARAEHKHRHCFASSHVVV
jgi:hypothetical protein